MRTKVTIFLMAAALAAPCFANPDDAQADDAQAVEQASARFYASLNAMFTGDVSPMEQVWSHADDVTYMGPNGGILVGWSEVLDIWKTQAALRLGGKIEPQETRMTIGADLACVQCYEQGENLDLQGQPVKVSIRATNLFRKENGEWKMIGHHTDLLPFLESRTPEVGEN